MRNLMLRGLILFLVFTFCCLSTSAFAGGMIMCYSAGTSTTGQWYNPNWLYRKQITIDKSMVATTTQTNFPALIYHGTDTDLINNAQTDLDDVLFTSSDKITKLSHELENPSSSSPLYAWVKGTYSVTEDTILYMYYGNTSASNQQDITGVWDTNYKGVWHQDETSGTVYDSTVNANNGIVYITSPGTQDATGQIDGADYFDGNDYMNLIGLPAVGIGNYTMEAWIKTTDLRAPIQNKRNLESDTSYLLAVGYGWASAADGKAAFGWDASGNMEAVVWPTPVNDGNRHFVVGVREETTWKISVDGGSFVTMSGSFNDSSSSTWQIAHHGGWGLYGNITIDELKNSSIARSADWITTEYRNQNAPASYETFGNQESQ